MSAVTVNNQLKKTEGFLTNSLEKLSSGFRINHAKDDAAGMAISNKMQAQINALDRASRNASDGVSVLDTTDGALDEVTNIIQRMRELAVQAANGTNSTTDREAIQAEIDQLRDEVDRVSSTTEFNTIKLLDGSLERRTYLDTTGISNVQVSDEVNAGKYSFEVEELATYASITTNTGAAAASATYTETQTTGFIVIGEQIANISPGMNADEVFEAIRAAAELAGADVSTASGNRYSLGDALVFTSQKAGSANPLYVFSYGITDGVVNSETADELGFTFLDVTKRDFHSVTTVGSENLKSTAENAGTLYIDGQTVSITAGMSAADIYSAIETAAAAVGVSVSTSSTYEVGSSMYFQYTDTSTGGAPAIYVDDIDLAAELGIAYVDTSDSGYSASTAFELTLQGQYANSSEFEYIYGDEDGNFDASKLAVLAIEATNNGLTTATEALVYKVGTDAKINLEDNFGNTATALAEGNEVTITDRNGFSIYFELEKTNAKGQSMQYEYDSSGNKVLLTNEYGNYVQDTDENGDLLYETDGITPIYKYKNKTVEIEVTDIGSMTLHVGANENQVMNVSIDEISAETLWMKGLDYVKDGGPEEAMRTLDKALEKVSLLRSKIGAYTNRLEYTVSSLDQFSENMNAAISRIKDVDMAEEMSEYSKYQVLSQASTSVLSQANDMPQTVLQLLQ